MFYISGFDSNRFKAFCKEGGKLPSFSVLSKYVPENFNSQLGKPIHLGDYNFYESNPSSHYYWISFQNAYMSLNHSADKATVYLSQFNQNKSDFTFAYLLMQAYMYRLINTGNLMIHSAATVFNNEAIMFCGSSGAGKSTQANLWKKHLNAKVLNYDKPCIINDNGAFYAHGSPWSGKEGLYINDFVPLKAIVFVKQAKKNRVVKLSSAQAFSNIYLHNYVYPFTQEIEDKYIEVIRDIINNNPVYELYCDVSENAVEVLYNSLFSTFTYKEVKHEIMKYKVKDCFYMSKVADEFIVFARGAKAVDFSATVVFNESGAFLWDSLKTFTTRKELTERLANNYSIDKETAEEDVIIFLKKMKENGLIEELEQ